jgi:hypothetical protein
MRDNQPARLLREAANAVLAYAAGLIGLLVIPHDRTARSASLIGLAFFLGVGLMLSLRTRRIDLRTARLDLTARLRTIFPSRPTRYSLPAIAALFGCTTLAMADVIQGDAVYTVACPLLAAGWFASEVLWRRAYATGGEQSAG